MQNYLAALGVYAGIYALMALGLNVIWGLAGMVNLGLVGFYAIGAYGSALLTTRLGWPIPAGALAGAACAAASGWLVALVTARLRGDYLAIVTLGFAEVIRLVASNETELTRGTDGISGIPGPLRGVLDPSGFNLLCLGLTWTVVAVTGLALSRMAASPWGRVLRAIREDEGVAEAAGKPVLRFKVQAFVAGAFVLGAAGAVYAHYNAYIAPDAFGPLVTLNIVLALSVGGAGRMSGAVLGGVLVVALTEAARFAGAALPLLRPVQVAAMQQASIGVLLILVLHLRPAGLLPERSVVRPRLGNRPGPAGFSTAHAWEAGMDENEVEGAARKVGGKIESAAGEALGDYKTQAQGLADKASGSAQKAYGQAKDAIQNAGDYGSQFLDQIEEAGDMLAEQIDQRPITALLIAAGVGFLLALATKPAPQVVYRRR